ncbi:hypothetical protein ADIAG_02786 [Paeniglutamicibacter gangotriensis Lz1y]|uniref:Uncharacterized protein n=1 Tax=Paeniglutamicibacter gangotriensis Lz1y TaxID=1276920 RepID=M7NH63_9MICC|nr:hypothetical protein ADIAG_02786 [Paeniglutamicibacter gangotriensis Lz1y]
MFPERLQALSKGVVIGLYDEWMREKADTANSSKGCARRAPDARSMRASSKCAELTMIEGRGSVALTRNAEK